MPRPFFHKLILPNTLQDKKLRIPDNFLRKLGNDFPPFVRLTVPGGPVWPIGLIKVEDKFWFHDGWQEFVERYAIRVGYFLVFRYEGNGVFNVHIFNLSASEINYQSNAISGRRFIIFEDMEDDETLENFSASRFDHLKRNTNLSTAANIYHSVTLPKREMSAQHSSLDSKSTPDDVKLSSDETPVKQPKKRGRKKIKVDPNEQPSSGQNEDDTEMRNRFYESASARKRTVTSEERERAVNAAKAFEPVNPFCRVVLRPSYLYRGCIMYLPSCFAEKHLNGVSGFIKLQFSNGKQWPVRCLYRGGRAKLSQGWYEFSLENNLGEGDVCVFELLKSRDIVLKVTVFRVLEDGGLMNSP